MYSCKPAHDRSLGTRDGMNVYTPSESKAWLWVPAKNMCRVIQRKHDHLASLPRRDAVCPRGWPQPRFLDFSIEAVDVHGLSALVLANYEPVGSCLLYRHVRIQLSQTKLSAWRAAWC